jgi:CheY-like chemotaxis protein
MKEPLNILVAEDNSDDVFLLEQAFRKARVSMSLNVVPDGVGAVAYLKGEGAYHDRLAHPFPDLLLLDLNMPRMNGFEVLNWVRQDSRCNRLPVHVLTSSSLPQDIQRAYELGANSYVVKPNRLDDLIAFAMAFGQWHRFLSLPTH